MSKATATDLASRLAVGDMVHFCWDLGSNEESRVDAVVTKINKVNIEVTLSDMRVKVLDRDGYVRKSYCNCIKRADSVTADEWTATHRAMIDEATRRRFARFEAEARAERAANTGFAA